MRGAVADGMSGGSGRPEAEKAEMGARLVARGQPDAPAGARPRRGKRRASVLLAAAAAMLAAGVAPFTPANAQVGTPPSQNSSPLPPAPPERIEPAPPAADGSGGVLRPPLGIDPGIRTTVPNPAPSTTPVIPPPGTPGGDPATRPR